MSALVVAIMVTGKTEARRKLALASVSSFLLQDYPNKYLLILNTGKPLEVKYPGVEECCIEQGSLTLGDLRNMGLYLARKQSADYAIQWDDDDWSAPSRISTQLSYCQKHDKDASILRWQVRYSVVKNAAFNFKWSYKSCPGIPGTILHKLDNDAYYPSKARAEDDDFLNQHFSKVAVIDNFPSANPGPELYIRTYHGCNTWDEAHIMLRAASSSNDWAVEPQQVEELQRFLSYLNK